MSNEDTDQKTEDTKQDSEDTDQDSESTDQDSESTKQDSESTKQDSESTEQDSEGTNQDDVERYESGQLKEQPEPTDEHKEKAAEMAKSYKEERPTTVLPGSDHTVTGTSVNDWIDDDGKPKFGESDASQDDEEGHRYLEKTDDRENVADE